MKKEIIIHFSFFIALFIFVLLARNGLSLTTWLFWLGGLFGTILPDIDHLIYIYYMRPQEYNSQRTKHMIQGKSIVESLQYLAETRSERTRLIFHTIYFQLIFFLFTFFVITSSDSLFGKGLVLAFYLHLFVDQLIDYMENKNIDNWLKQTSVTLNNVQTRIYLVAVGITVLIFGFVL